METSLAEHVRKSLSDGMPRGLYIGGGMVMCALTGVPLTGVFIDDDGAIDDFRCANISSRFPFGVALPLIIVAGAAALQAQDWPKCEALLECDRERFADMASPEHFEFAMRQARRILVAHVWPIVMAGAMVAGMRLPPMFVEWDDRYLDGLREVIASVDRSKLPEFLMGIRLHS